MTFSIQDPAVGSENYASLMGVIGTLKGYADWRAPIDHISFDDDSRFAHVTRNLGTGGHQIWRKSTDNSQLVAVTDAGLAVTALTATSLTVTPGATSLQAMSATTGSFSSTLGVTGTSTLGVVNAGATTVTTLTASSTVQGTRFISTVTAPTAPLQVASAIEVGNLNANFLQGFTKAQLDSAYVDVAGDTMTGQLNIQANQALKIQGASGLGGFFLNATNIADPVLEFKDASGDTMVAINPSGSTYALDVNAASAATNAARFTGAVLGTTTITATGNLSGAKLLADTAAPVGGEKLRVASGSSRLEGSLTVTTGGADITGSSVFQSGLSITSGGLTVTSGGIAATAAPISVGSTVAASGDIRGTTTMSIKALNGGSDMELISVGSGFLSIGSGGTGGILFQSTNQRFRWDSTGIAFFGAATAAKQTITGSRGGNAALASFLSALANYGFITDSTTA